MKKLRFPADKLFQGPKGGSASNAIQQNLKSVVEAAGLRYGRQHEDGVTFHTFRHSMASLALNEGIPESTVQRMGNWKTRTMVSRYAHLSDENFRSAAATVANLLDDDETSGPDTVEEPRSRYSVVPEAG